MLVTALPTPLDASARVLVEPAEVGLAGRAVGEGPVAVTGPDGPRSRARRRGNGKSRGSSSRPGHGCRTERCPTGQFSGQDSPRRRAIPQCTCGDGSGHCAVGTRWMLRRFGGALRPRRCLHRHAGVLGRDARAPAPSVTARAERQACHHEGGGRHAAGGGDRPLARVVHRDRRKGDDGSVLPLHSFASAARDPARGDGPAKTLREEDLLER